MPDDKIIDQTKALAEIVGKLRERFPEASEQAVQAAVDEATAQFAGAKVKDFVPVLVEKAAKARLKGKS